MEGPKWLTNFKKNNESGFDSTHIPEGYFAEIRAEERAKCQRETSSVMLAAVEPCGIAQILRAEDYSNLQRLIRVTVLVLTFLTIMKLLLKKNTFSPDESTDQDIAVAETLWITEVFKRESLVRYLEEAVWHLHRSSGHYEMYWTLSQGGATNFSQAPHFVGERPLHHILNCRRQP